jgi:hypothetical protein
MQAIRMLAVIGCAALVGCSFAVEGLSTVGGPAPAAPSAPLDGGATLPLDAAPPTSPTPPSPPAPAPTAPVGGNYGDACDPSHPCASSLVCAHQLGMGPGAISLAGGYCTSACNDAPCLAGATCVDFGKGGGQLCMAECPPASCRDGYSCCDAAGAHVCLPGDHCPASGG